jgi:hypothetical protein
MKLSFIHVMEVAVIETYTTISEENESRGPHRK